MLQQLKQERVFAHFFEICRHPHPSHHEQELSCYLYDWAKGLGLEVYQDKAWNLIIKKPASPGYETHPTVLLQAHIDMVCQKEEQVQHDFLRDPIDVQVDGDWLSTGNKTTLGADNGIGVAYIMAVLEDRSLMHPPIEAVLTTAEEDDFSGAIAVDGSQLHAQHIINLDFAEDDAILCGSSGGNGCEIVLPVEWKAPDTNLSWHHIYLKGLPGGHSGEDIHRGRGSAATLMTEILQHLYETIGKMQLAGLRCGNFRLAIPRDGEALVGVEHPKQLQTVLAQLEQDYQVQYHKVAPNLTLTTEAAASPLQVVTEETLEKILCLLHLCPNGMFQMNSQMPHVVESSDNLGEVRLEEQALRLVFEIRATYQSSQTFLNRALNYAANCVGAECRTFHHYPSWHYREELPLLEKAKEIYKSQFGESPRTVVFHAGLETGYFLEKLPQAQAIAVGPTAHYFHAPGEKLSISSTRRMYQFLLALLAEL